MKHYSRKKETLKSLLYLLIGVFGIWVVNNKLQVLAIEKKSVSVEATKEGTSEQYEKQGFDLDCTQIFSWKQKEFSEQSIRELIESQLLGGTYIEHVDLNLSNPSGYISLRYKIGEYNGMFSDARKDQIALLDASILMSLYDEINTVKVDIQMENALYSKVLYRPDLEAYYHADISAYQDLSVFERIAGEFIDSQNVSMYCKMKHPYDSLMGEEVENFYKMNFPVSLDKVHKMQYIDEELENDLVNKYGYKLFLQGLQYDNDQMNYYSAYRLMEFYESGKREEIQLALAACEIKTNCEEVKSACQKVIDFLSSLDQREMRIVGRFAESSLGGGKKIYALDERGLYVIATWQDEMEAGLSVVSVSPNNQYVLCKAITSKRSYYYILPIRPEAGEMESYIINETGIYEDNVEYASELVALVNRQSVEADSQEMELKFEWYLNALLQITDGTNKYYYDMERNTLETEAEFDKNFGKSFVIQYLNQHYHVTEKAASFYYPVRAEATSLLIGQEKIVVREYTSMAQKNIDLFKNAEAESKIVGRTWSKGRVIINYAGNQSDIIERISEIMA